MLIYVKIFFIIRFVIGILKSWQGTASVVNIRDLIFDFFFLGFAVYILIRFESFSNDSIYLDYLLVSSMLAYIIKLVFTIRIFVLSNDFGIDSENRLIFMVEELMKKNNFKKAFNVLISHAKIVKYSGPLLIKLGDVYCQINKFENAYDCYVEATELSDEEHLLLLASQKAFSICSKELNDFDSAKEFIESQIIRDISENHITELERLIKIRAN